MNNNLQGDVLSNIYSKAFKQLPEPLLVIDNDLVILDINDQGEKIIGEQAKVIGKPLSHLFYSSEFDVSERVKEIAFNQQRSNVERVICSVIDHASTILHRKVSLKILTTTQDQFVLQIFHEPAYLNLLADIIQDAKNNRAELLNSIVDVFPYPLCIIDVTKREYLVRNKTHYEVGDSLVKNSSLENIPYLIDSELPYSVFINTVENVKVPFVEEHEYSTQQGDKLYYEIHGYPLHSTHSNSHLVVLHYHDRTREKQLVNENEEYRDTLHDLFLNLPGMIFRCLNESNWTIEYASSGCRPLTGYSPDELISNNKAKYGDLIFPEDRSYVWDVIQDAIKRKRYYDIKYRIVTKKGVVKWVQERGRASYDKHGKVVSIGGFITDISEGAFATINLQKELHVSEAIASISIELLKDTVTPLKISKLVIDSVLEITKSKHAIIFAPEENGDGYSIFNHDLEAEIKTVNSDYYNGEQLKFLNLLINEGKTFINNNPSEIVLPGLFNEPTVINRILSVPAFTNNALSGLLILIDSDEDYTHSIAAICKRFVNMFALGLYRLKAEETLQDAKIKAEESDRLKSLFLSNMSHEIRTPMNAIVGFAEMLQDSDLDIDQKNKFLDVIIKSGDNLLRLINDIIDISRIEAGQLKLDYSECLVNEMIADLEPYFKQELFRQKKERLKLYSNLGHPESDFAIYTDSIRLKQILNNLIGNAIKFTDEGFIEFGYKLKAGFIEFFVRDSGIGIAPEKQKLIFERFGQVQEAISRNLTGTGLGLTISKNLVEMLGGELWVDSIPGEGSTFYFTLPIRTAKAKKVTLKADSPDNNKNSLDLVGKTILVVEDVDTNFFYMSSLLQKHNCKILRANNGQKAIDMCIADHTIDLVLMDIELPILDGYKATAEIKKIRPDLPVIAQTAFAMMGERERSKEAGCDDYIAKPIRKEELMKILSKFL